MTKTFYKPQKEKVSATPQGTGKFLRESDVRMIIDRKLREAGWNIEDKNQVSTQERYQLIDITGEVEEIVTGFDRGNCVNGK